MTHRDPLAFTEDGLCQQVDAAIFFVEVGGSTREAKAVCRRCGVRAECLAYALENRIVEGVWGGTAEKERARMLPSSRSPVRDRDVVCVTCRGLFHGHPRRKYCETCKLAAKHTSAAGSRRRAA